MRIKSVLCVSDMSIPGETGRNQKGPAWPMAPPLTTLVPPQAKTQAGPGPDPVWTHSKEVYFDMSTAQHGTKELISETCHCQDVT